MTNTENPEALKTYEVTVTDYVTNVTKTWTVCAPNGDAAFELAGRLLDPTELHTIGGSFHRTTNPAADCGLR